LHFDVRRDVFERQASAINPMVQLEYVPTMFCPDRFVRELSRLERKQCLPDWGQDITRAQLPESSTITS
tara:strand:+ start:2470 stop:2676 length:207 start_codon:yes stop_codon:yes gene_type:complete